MVLVSYIAPGAVEAQGRQYWVESFEADIRVLESGEIDVTERLTFHFEGSFNGIYRDIPIKYETPWGLDYGLRLEPVSVTAATGAALRHEAGVEGDDFRFKVWVPDANNASRTVVLRYRVGRERRPRRHGRLRGAVKSAGCRIPRCSTPAFARTAPEHIPERLKGALEPVLETIAMLTGNIQQYERQIVQLCQGHYELRARQLDCSASNRDGPQNAPDDLNPRPPECE